MTVPGLPDPDPEVLADLEAEVTAHTPIDLGTADGWRFYKGWLIRTAVARLIGVDTRQMTPMQAQAALEEAGATLSDMIHFNLSINLRMETLRAGAEKIYRHHPAQGGEPA